MLKFNLLKLMKCSHFPSGKRFYSETVNHIISEDVTPQIKRIILNNPKRRNAFSLEFMTLLESHLNRIKMSCESNESDIRVIILKSSINTFSGGHDLMEFHKGNEESRKAVFDKAATLMNNLENYFIPVIVSVHGAAAAAGCQLVATCDIAVCSETSSFSTPGILAGLFCSTPGVAIGRSLPRKIALEMVLTGEPISAQQALQYGLVNHVVPQAEVDIVSEKIAQKIASLSTPVVKFGKRVFIDQMKIQNKEAAYDYAGEMMVENLQYGDCVEGITAFIDKRKPRWSQSK